MYNAVLAANREVLEKAKVGENNFFVMFLLYLVFHSSLEVSFSGVSWTDMHKLAESVILSHLKEAGLVKGDVKEMVEVSLKYSIFLKNSTGTSSRA